MAIAIARESGTLDALFSVHHVCQDRVDSAQMTGPFRFQPRKHVILDTKGDQGSFGPHPERDHLGQLLVSERRNVREVDRGIGSLGQAVQASALLFGQRLIEDMLGIHAY